MKAWLEKELGRVPPAGSSPRPFATRSRWPTLTRFLDDGRIELDNNVVERAIWPIALGRENIYSRARTVAAADGQPSAP
jgi:transposase